MASLPARWEQDSAATARRLLQRAQNTMRVLRSVRQVELVTSGPGASARTQYRLKAPDHMALQSSAGTHSVIIGERQWPRASDTPWRPAAPRLGRAVRHPGNYGLTRYHDLNRPLTITPPNA